MVTKLSIIADERLRQCDQAYKFLPFTDIDRGGYRLALAFAGSEIAVEVVPRLF
jgi:hypothetical protein